MGSCGVYVVPIRQGTYQTSDWFGVGTTTADLVNMRDLYRKTKLQTAISNYIQEIISQIKTTLNDSRDIRRIKLQSLYLQHQIGKRIFSFRLLKKKSINSSPSH